MVQIHTPQPVTIKNIPLRYVFYFTCVVLDLNHRSNVVQPPKPGGRQYAGLRQQRFPGDEVNPPPTTSYNKKHTLAVCFLFIPHPAIIKWILQQKYAIISTIITNKRKR